MSRFLFDPNFWDVAGNVTGVLAFAAPVALWFRSKIKRLEAQIIKLHQAHDAAHPDVPVGMAGEHSE